MKKDSILHLTLFLAIVAAIAGGALAFANQLTLPVIEENNLKAEKQTLLEMYPEASLDDFQPVTDDGIMADHPEIESIYKYGDSIVVFKCSVSGFDGGTVFVVAIDPVNNKIDNFKTISNGDTKGIGSKITEPAFAESVIGKDADGQLDTISGATITSTPVVEAIQMCAGLAGEID